MFCKWGIKRILIISYTILVLTLQGCTFAGNPVGKNVPKDNTVPGLHIKEATVDIDGMNDRFNIFFLADSHISKCDDRDKDLMMKAAQRSLMFKQDGMNSWDRFDMLIAKIKNSDIDIVVMGGDIVDSAMYASIDHVRNRIAPWIYHIFTIWETMILNTDPSILLP